MRLLYGSCNFEMEIKMKRILVTGGAGFLGSNLCKRLIKEGNHVICVDNLYTGRMVNIEELMDNPEFEFINHNIIEPLDIDNLDEIYNLACPASPPHYQKSPTYTTKTCVLGILNMLELATKNNAKIMQFSTSEVYGDPFVHPQVETYRGNVNPIGIRSCYDEGKRVAETLCFDYNREFGTRIKVIRIFNTYGPMMDPKDGRVVSNFIIQALKGEDITIYGDGSQTRSFCYVDDLIEGIVRMMASREDFLGPVNLGNPGEFTIRELAEIVLEMVDTKSKLVCMDLPKDDPTQRKPDITVAGRELNGWAPKISLRENCKINGSNRCFPASRQQSRLIRMENRCPPGLPVCTMGTYMKPYGSWPIITRVSYTWQDLYLELLCAEDGGKKKKFRQHCGCR